METKLEALIRELYQHVERIFADHGGLQIPAWMMEDAAGKQSMLLTPVDDDRAKNLMAAALRKVLIQKKAVRYAMAMEVWIARDHSEDAVIISGEERDTGEKHLVFHRIDRSRSKPRLKPPEVARAEGGRFFGLFEDAG
jgi:hypothetical protein